MSNIFSFNADPEEKEARLRQEAVDAAYRALKNGVSGLSDFPVFLRECFERRAWEQSRVFPGGTRQGPISFKSFVQEPYPVGLGSSYDAIEALIKTDTEVFELFVDLKKRGPGGNNNPHGRSGKPETEINLDNVQVDKDLAPTGNSAEAGLRKLQKAAAEGNEEAETQLAAVRSGEKSIHAACVDSGLRKSSRIDPDVKARCSRSVAEWIVEHAGQSDISHVVADLFACGAKSIAVEIKNLTGEAIMDRRFG